MQARLPHFRPVMKAYFDGVLTLGLRVMRLMSMALDLPPDWFTVRHQRPLLNLRPLHYSADLSRPEEARSPEDATLWVVG
jgi:isopenicillin N synthase-like dioxygenase